VIGAGCRKLAKADKKAGPYLKQRYSSFVAPRQQSDEELINEAFCDAFTIDTLERMVKLKLGRDLYTYAAKGNLRQVVFELADAARREGFLSDLVTAAREFNPGNERLATLTLSGKARTEAAFTGATTVATESVRLGFEALRDLMKEPRVRDAVVTFRSDFEDCSERIALLGDYKDIHDQLHQLQRCCYDGIAPELRKFPDDDIARDTLASYGAELWAITAELRTIGGRPTEAAGEARRTADDLDRIDKAFSEALEAGDAAKLNSTVRNLGRLLARQPSRINTRLNDTARSLRLGELLGRLAAIHSRLSSVRVETEQTRQFEEGLRALRTLEDALQRLTENHDSWQHVDDEMRLIDSNPDQLADAWSAIQANMAALWTDVDEAWARNLADTAQKLDAALSASDPARAKRFFQLVRRAAADRFYRVDTQLKRQCDELRAIGGPLNSVLSLME
jgi:hypothetical protein